MPVISKITGAPFRFWCQKILPAVYDDSLSYYELLCKVVDYLNKVMEDDINVVNLVNELEDFVNNYFNNLDVQQEINNKLDAMAEDGSLLAVVAPHLDEIIAQYEATLDADLADYKETVNDELDAQVAEIDTFKSDINSQVTTQNTTISNFTTSISTTVSEQDNDISVMQSQMNNFIQSHSGELTFTELYSTTEALGAHSVNETFALSDDYTKYTELDIYWSYNSVQRCTRVKTSDVLATGVEISFYADEAVSQTNVAPMFFPFMKIVNGNSSHTELKIASAYSERWSGASADSATRDIASSAADYSAGSIIKVVGVSYQDSAELLDIRVGADGTIFPTAGDAVREQYTDLKSALYNKLDSTALNYDYFLLCNDPSLWEKGFIDSATGENGSPASATGKARIRTISYINGIDSIIRIDGNAYIRVLRYRLDGTYVDAIDNVSKYSNFEYSEYKYRLSVRRPIDAPVDESLALYVLLSDKSYLADKNYVDSEIGTVDTEVGTLKNILSLNETVQIPFVISDTSKYVKFNTGELVTSSVYSATDYVDVSEYTYIRYRQLSTTELAPTYGMAFYDKDKVYISGERLLANQSYNGYAEGLKQIEVPANAVYARFTTRSNVETYGSFEVNGKSKIFNELRPYYSPFVKNVIFGDYSSEWYKGQGDSYTGFNINTTYAEVITAWDALMTNSKGYITREAIGVSSDGQNMYCYKLIPTRYRNNTGTSVVNNPPTFLIVPTLHGFEKSAAYGSYYFARDLVYNYDKNPVLNSIRTKCAIYVVPVGNPWGFDNRQRKNYNGVDLNRNWGEDSSGVTDPSSPYYPGAEPFDQPETQAIKSVIDSNNNLLFLVDYHTDGQYKVSSWANVNWMDCPHAILDDEYFKKSYIAAQIHISEITENLQIEYNLDTSGESIGSLTIGSGVGVMPTIGYYARTQNIMGFTFEGNNGLPSESGSYSDVEQKINSELIGNWIKNLLLVYKDASLK